MGSNREEDLIVDVNALAAGIGQLPPAFWAENEYTIGAFTTEKDSAEAFDVVVARTGLFHVFREITGDYIQPKMLTETRSTRCRIDRILMPTDKLLSAGWKHGPVGVEIEASRMKVGGVISQCLDYHRAVWHLTGNRTGYHIMLEWIAIWPYGGGACGIGSIMAQHRICGAWTNKWSPLVLKTGGCNALVYDKDGKTHAKGFNSGSKTGHRGSK